MRVGMDQIAVTHDRHPTSPRARQSDNFLLQNLSPADFALVGPQLERVPFRMGDTLARAGDPIAHVYFPEGAIAGILAPLDGEHRFAVALVGQEGFIGWPLVLGDDRWPYEVAMRAEDGEALRLPARALTDAVERSATLRHTMLRFTSVLMTQMASTIVSSLAHPVERRMARWILLYHDRVRADEICMTHEEFRLMLGVRRSSVTDALHRLEDAQAVRTARGRVVVVDRGKLMALAGETYGRPEREYRRLIIGNAP